MEGRDPLRIWLAQLAADLQWPVPGTGSRFSAWLLALEVERDDEAVAAGALSENLADAILAAARFHLARTMSLCARAEGAGEGVAWRVRRLIAGDLPSSTARKTGTWMVPAWCFALVTITIWLGVDYGDSMLAVLPDMGP
jgi:hypothetical protein